MRSPQIFPAAVGGLLGRLGYHALPDRRRICVRNLSLVLPEAPGAELAQRAKRAFRNAGASLLESMTLPRLSRRRICRLVTFEGWENFAAAEALGRGVIVSSAHLGLYEGLAAIIALFRGPTHFVARPLPLPALDRYARRLRERFGNRTIDKHTAARGMLRTLEERGRISILIDQRVHPNQGVEVPFFGMPSWTSPLPAQISLRTGAPVLPLYMIRRPGGRYRVTARDPIVPRSPGQPSGGSNERAILELTAAYTAATEAAIRADLEQWVWMHDRWRRH